jgi:hypothetical protein
MFWNLATLAVLGVGNYFGPVNLGVPINVNSSDPMIRLEQMMIDSENLHKMRDELRPIHGNDQPSHLTPYRIHGGVGPKSPEI